ncbi:hypothetical protein GUITHDRAFT_155869 [Guillardia theta CCMP2712]|uniref:Uncharacterized protein n=1 Tax=Guillardia theta (strain CCMP2712) TaxID=905079 RepID=L1ICN6_GUITC|nr:hypothetical protein GUITHDRAFT_155869 [Guillardia theta CCMP2712]EKX33998.1 hypothetical protein GUITHDRAFT_155869 [Guillardia theta CCMP2712]|eukprot:XP_005820978.1 hypothetical protein GUITHDRAFT_155869 [Guillardia theta CCMP2712]
MATTYESYTQESSQHVMHMRSWTQTTKSGVQVCTSAYGSRHTVTRHTCCPDEASYPIPDGACHTLEVFILSE